MNPALYSALGVAIPLGGVIWHLATRLSRLESKLDVLFHRLDAAATVESVEGLTKILEVRRVGENEALLLRFQALHGSILKELREERARELGDIVRAIVPGTPVDGVGTRR